MNKPWTVRFEVKVDGPESAQAAAYTALLSLRQPGKIKTEVFEYRNGVMLHGSKQDVVLTMGDGSE